jgi:hypothetical protein
LLAQIVGDEAEMERLQNKAEDAIADGDADGAAANSGKAALMAAQLAGRQTDRARVRFYRGAEALFRSQEHAYRALALFQRAGGQPPASSGVCSTMRLAGQAVQEALLLLAEEASDRPNQHSIRQTQRFRAIAGDWGKTIGGMATDFQCQQTDREPSNVERRP